MSTESKILQQIYTRGREGIFRTNEGLDTVAKSPTLDNNFIKKTLHPFCVYMAPQELRKRGEQDLSHYPEALTVFHAESGELVVGRSKFAGSDFTGQRDTIFVHNFIIPKERKEQLLRSPNALFRIQGFQSQFDEQAGKTLPELDELDYSHESYLHELSEVLAKLRIDEKMFKQLLWAMMMSISSNKKVYIALDVDVTEISTYSNKLTEILFHCLPYELRMQFGFTTYNNEPQGKKFIDLMFVEKGSIRAGDRNLDKDYIFDFPQERFVNVELPSQDQYYLDFAWEHKDQPDQLTAFYEFAEEALQGIVGANRLSIATYYQLCVLFLVEQGSSDRYEANKDGILSSTLGYLDVNTIPQKPRLNELFWNLVNREISLIKNGSTPSLAYLQGMVDYYRIAGDSVKGRLVTYLVHFLYNGWNHHEDSNYTIDVFASMIKEPELFRAVIKEMHTQERFIRVYEDYVQGRMAQVTSILGIQEEITFWVNYSPEGSAGAFFQEQCLRHIKPLMEKDRSRIQQGKSLFEFVAQLYKKHDKKLYEQLCDEIEKQVAKSVLAYIDLGQLTAADFDQLGYLIGEVSIVDGLDKKELDKLQVLNAVHAVLGNEPKQDAEVFEFLNRLPFSQLEQTQWMLQKFLKERLNRTYYEKILFAFYRRNNNGANAGFEIGPEYRYTEMLIYIHNSSAEDGEVYNFLIWTASNPYFLSRNQQLLNPYKKAIHSFFDQQDHGALKKSSVMKILMATDNASFKKNIREIRLEQSSGVTRFLVRYQRPIVRISLVLIIAAGITIGAVYGLKALFTDTDAPTPDVSPSSSVSPSPFTTPSITPGPTGSPNASSGTGTTGNTSSVSPSPTAMIGPTMKPSTSPSLSPSPSPTTNS